ncbi:MAG: hypothetical protein PUJ55_10255 [Clostridiales bacterium]|nr:hypothetical protein [Roseburia sp.]MDD7637312.1 hypothetical protein [Clostridiales bacterium]MDY4111541.1 hypothetical protein [Roseburia sp.]
MASIYVLCPANVKTGGTELLHQLVKELNHIGKNAYITYLEIPESGQAMNEAFSCYTDTYRTEADIEDYAENVLVVPEIYCTVMERYRSIQKYIWWLSVDNYLIHNSFADRKKLCGIKSALKACIRGKLKDKTKLVQSANLHMCQSQYAIEYVKSIGIPESRIVYLSDYVNDVYLEHYESQKRLKKEDVILYNPKKGATFTKKLIAAAPELNWVPLINMSTEEVQQRMQTSKVYIDFGNHPGKDRFPREAAVSGCIVITGKRGAAKYYEDVRIPEKYKFDEDMATVSEITERMKECLADYEVLNQDFAEYREYILGEKTKFAQDVKMAFAR